MAYNNATETYVPLIEAIYNEMGIQPRFILVPSERSISDTNNGVFDADIARVEGSLKKYPNLIFTKVPLIKTQLFAFVRKGSNIRISKIQDLKKYSIGIILGSKLPENFVIKEGLKVETASTLASFNSMFKGGRFEIALVTSNHLLAQDQLINEYGERTGPVLATTRSFHVMNKKNANLVSKFDFILSKLKANGQFEKLTKRRPAKPIPSLVKKKN